MRREINKIRTDALEQKIAMYIFCGQHEKADAIKDLAKGIGAPIDEKEINELVKKYREYDNE